MLTNMDKLYESVAANGPVCVGLDTEISYLPTTDTAKTAGENVVAFNRALIDATKGVAGCYKVQIAYYESLGQDTAASAKMALCSPPPRAPATARANTSPGKARNISDTRMSTASAHPPKKPPQRPTAVPSTVTAATSSSVEKMLVRLPTMTRDSISRP